MTTFQIFYVMYYYIQLPKMILSKNNSLLKKIVLVNSNNTDLSSLQVSV